MVAEDVFFPNGMVITPDGKTLIAAETFGRCLTAFDIEASGDLSEKEPGRSCLTAQSPMVFALTIKVEFGAPHQPLMNAFGRPKVAMLAIVSKQNEVHLPA